MDFFLEWEIPLNLRILLLSIEENIPKVWDKNPEKIPKMKNLEN